MRTDGGSKIQIGEAVVLESQLATPVVVRVPLEEAVVLEPCFPLVLGLFAKRFVALQLTIELVTIFQAALLPAC